MAKDKSNDIKKKVSELVSFDIAENYYDEDMKNELVDAFKEILFMDDETVRQFLEKFFVSAKEAAAEFDLISSGEEDFEDEKGEEETEEPGEESEGEPEEEPSEEEPTEEPAEEEPEAPEEPAEEEPEEEKESTLVDAEKIMSESANRFMSDYDR